MLTYLLNFLEEDARHAILKKTNFLLKENFTKFFLQHIVYFVIIYTLLRSNEEYKHTHRRYNLSFKVSDQSKKCISQKIYINYDYSSVYG